MATYLGGTILAPIQFRSNQPGFVSDTVSLGRQSAAQSNQRWELEFRVHHDDPVSFFRQTVTNTFDSHTLQMPQIYDSIGAASVTVTGTVDVRTNTAAGQSSVPIQTTSNANGRVIPAGRFVKFSNHNKVYMLTADATVSSNQATAAIFPALTTAVSTAHDMEYLDADVVLRVHRDISSVNGISYSDGVLMDSGTITLIEDV